MSAIVCLCGAVFRHCAQCGRPLEQATLPTRVRVDCVRCPTIVLFCPCCGEPLRARPDPRRPCWACGGRKTAEGCKRCGGSGVDPVDVP